MKDLLLRTIYSVLGVCLILSVSNAQSSLRSEVRISDPVKAPSQQNATALSNYTQQHRRFVKGPDDVFANSFRSQRLSAADGGPADNFGTSVAVDGNIAIIGAPFDDVGPNVDQGSAYIFVRNGSTWDLQAQLNASDGSAGDQFGISVGISGDTAIIGADGSHFSRGSAYIFVRRGTSWSQQSHLTASDGLQADHFGWSVAISLESVVIGAYGDDIGSQVDRGSAYVFARSGKDWSQQAHLFGVYDRPRDYFGYSVGISADTVIVGVFLADVGMNVNQGSAYIFARNGTTWSQWAYLTAPDGAAGDRFGTSVAIHKGTAIVGAFFHADGANIAQGAAYIFVRNDPVWEEQAKLTATDGAASDYFGNSVSIDCDNAVVGAFLADIRTVADQGAAYIFTRSGTAWKQTNKLATPYSSANGNFGNSVSFSGDTALIGFPGDTVGASSSQGSALVYDLASGTRKARFDFDGDGESDIAVFRPGDNTWYINYSSNGEFYPKKWGQAGDYLMPGDFDGDGKTDIAVWREIADQDYSYCFILNSSSNTVRTEQFGQQWDVLTVGDWDGDGIDDPAVYHDSATGSQSYFYYRGSLNDPNGNITTLQWGMSGDRPVMGDYDGDGKQDAAVFRPSTGLWYILQSSDAQVRYESWGLATDKFVTADYDGDGKTDLAVYRDGIWYIRRSSDGQMSYAGFGLSTDLPVPADYDGDGKADVAVFRDGMWYMMRSSDNQFAAQHWGLSGDKPVPAAYLP